MKRTAKRGRRTQRNQRRKTMRREVRKSQRKSQRRNTMRRKTKRNKRTQQGGVIRSRSSSFRSAIGKRRDRRNKKKAEAAKVLKSKLMNQLSAASQSLQMAQHTDLSDYAIDTLDKEVRRIEKDLLDSGVGKVIPTFQDTIRSGSLDVLDTVGAVGDVAYEIRDEAMVMSRNKIQQLMNSFRRGRQMVVDYAAGKGVLATQRMTETAIMLLGALRQLDEYLKSLQTPPPLPPPEPPLLEDRPQPPQ